MWKDKLTGLEVQVIRSFKDIETPPYPDELPKEEDREQVREWERQIGRTFVNKVPGWGKKGHW